MFTFPHTRSKVHTCEGRGIQELVQISFLGNRLQAGGLGVRGILYTASFVKSRYGDMLTKTAQCQFHELFEHPSLSC